MSAKDFTELKNQLHSAYNRICLSHHNVYKYVHMLLDRGDINADQFIDLLDMMTVVELKNS